MATQPKAIQPEKLQSLRVHGTQADLEKIMQYIAWVEREPADEEHRVSFAPMNQQETIDHICFEANALYRTLKDAINNTNK